MLSGDAQAPAITLVDHEAELTRPQLKADGTPYKVRHNNDGKPRKIAKPRPVYPTYDHADWEVYHKGALSLIQRDEHTEFGSYKHVTGGPRGLYYKLQDAVSALPNGLFKARLAVSAKRVLATLVARVHLFTSADKLQPRHHLYGSHAVWPGTDALCRDAGIGKKPGGGPRQSLRLALSELERHELVVIVSEPRKMGYPGKIYIVQTDTLLELAAKSRDPK